MNSFVLLVVLASPPAMGSIMDEPVAAEHPVLTEARTTRLAQRIALDDARQTLAATRARLKAAPAMPGRLALSTPKPACLVAPEATPRIFSQRLVVVRPQLVDPKPGKVATSSKSG